MVVLRSIAALAAGAGTLVALLVGAVLMLVALHTRDGVALAIGMPSRIRRVPAAALLLLCACSGTDARSDVGGDVGDVPEEERYGGAIVIALDTDAPTLFPPAAFGTSLTAEIVWSQLYWPMIRDLGFGGSYRLGLADSVRFSDDSLHVDYFLDPAFTWHDGHPVRAEDVTFGMRVWTSAESSLMPNRLDMLASAGALDSLTVRVTLNRRYPPHIALEPGMLALPLPKHILGDVPLSKLKNHRSRGGRSATARSAFFRGNQTTRLPSRRTLISRAGGRF